MRLLTGAVYFGRLPEHASISEPVDPSMRWQPASLVRFRAPASISGRRPALQLLLPLEHASFRDGVGTRCGCEGRGAVRPEPT